MLIVPVSVPPAPFLPGVEHVSGCTSVVVVALLLPFTGSVRFVDTDAVFDIVDGEFGVVTTIATVALAPELIVPRAHVTTPADCEHVP